MNKSLTQAAAAESLAASPASTEPVAAAWRAIGCDVRLLVTDPAALPTARRMLEADLDALDRAASRFRADSEVSALSRAGGEPMPISPVLADAIAAALIGARISEGDLDPTMGSDLAGLGYDRTFTSLADAGAFVGIGVPQPTGSPERATPPVAVRRAPTWADVELDQAAGTVRIPAGMVLDLGATAKARCADLAAARISAACDCGVLVSLGGDIAVAGPAPEGGWVIRVQDVTGDPEAPATGGPTCQIAITAGGLATSSTTARRWRRGGSVLHHILDPRTGRPAADVWRTVTVAAPSALLANIASTTSVIRGRAARSWLQGLGVQARLVAQAATNSPTEIVLVGGWPKSDEEQS